MDDAGGVSFCWMNGIGQISGNRWVSYNYYDETGNLAHGDEGVLVSTAEGAGYTNLDVFSDGRAEVAYHNGNNLFLTSAIDAARGFGLFQLMDPPEVFPGSEPGYWPYTTIDRQGRIHMASAVNGTPRYVLYTRSADEGQTWEDVVIVDTMSQVNTTMTSSRVSDKVMLMYSKGIPGDEYDTVGDILYVESLDGVTWNFNDIHNVTNYSIDDTLRAWLDFDAVYDYNDELHIIWAALHWTETSSTEQSIFHWSESTGITLVAEGNWVSYPGTANGTLSKCTIGVDSDNKLYVVWSQFDDIDVSSGAFSNGEIYACGSADGGLNWGLSVNLTNTNTEGCMPGDCDSDHWPSMAEIVTDSVHILYINDKDAGAAVRDEGLATENPVLYLSYPANELVPQGVDEGSTPENYAVSISNFPNPFNATTTIDYSIETGGDVKVEVYNILGEKVTTLVEEYHNPGQYTVNWRASESTSGVYFARISVDAHSATSRMVLLK